MFLAEMQMEFRALPTNFELMIYEKQKINYKNKKGQDDFKLW